MIKDTSKVEDSIFEVSAHSVEFLNSIHIENRCLLAGLLLLRALKLNFVSEISQGSG